MVYGCVPDDCTGKLPLAPEGDGTWHLTPDEFHWLVCGVDWQQVNGHDLAKWLPETPSAYTQNTAITQ